MLAAVEPGTGQVRALAVNRKFKLDDPKNPTNKLSTDPAKTQEGHQGHLPEHHQPADHRRRRHHRLPGRLDVQDLHDGGGAGEGHPARLHRSTPRRRTSPSTSIEPGPRRPARAPATTARSNADRAHGRPAQHVDRASAARSTRTSCRCRAGRRRERGRRGQAAGHPVPRAQDDQRPRRRQGRTSWGAFTLGVSDTTPLELANAYATLAARRHVLRADPGAGDHATPRARSSTSPTRAASRRSSPDVARAAVDAARCPVGDKSRPRQVRAARTAGDVRSIVGHPVAGKTGTTDRRRPPHWSSMTKQLAVAGILADPDWPQTNMKMKHAARRTASTRGAGHAARRHGGQAGDPVQAAGPEDRPKGPAQHPRA